MQLSAAETILQAARAKARELSLQPLAIVVLDQRGALKAAIVEDGASLKRAEIAIGKAHGCIALGIGGRALHKRAEAQGYFIAAARDAVGGMLVPVPGGVLVRDGAGQVLGAIGISGDTSDNDEACALAGIAAAGLRADTGA